MSAPLTEEQKSEIVELAEGNYDQARERVEALGQDVSDLDDILSDWGREVCAGCGWVKETHEFVDADSEPFPDDACRECNGYEEPE